MSTEDLEGAPLNAGMLQVGIGAKMFRSNSTNSATKKHRP